MISKVPVGVLVSGRGSNLQALIDACHDDNFPARIAVVISNVEGALALTRAHDAHIATEVVDHKAFASRDLFEATLVAKLQHHGVHWVCLAGFMRLLGSTLLDAFPGHVLNIHPSLLPAFPGVAAAKQALAHGVKVSGCTVHLVDRGTDSGPILAQSSVPVLPDDDEAKLSARILVEEHRLYPIALRWAVEEKIRVTGRTVRVD